MLLLSSGSLATLSPKEQFIGPMLPNSASLISVASQVCFAFFELLRLFHLTRDNIYFEDNFAYCGRGEISTPLCPSPPPFLALVFKQPSYGAALSCTKEDGSVGSGS